MKSIQDLVNLINLLAIKNRKENGTYAVTLASLTGLLVVELSRVNDFFESEGIKNLNDWELHSKNVVEAELEHSHPTLSLSELFNSTN